ncbi:MAG: LysR family transcriptional regulator substrate-binding protein, partial [Suipraeoptans sp.]
FEAQFFKTEKLYLAVPSDYKMNGKLQDYQIDVSDIISDTVPETINPIPLDKFSKEDFIMLKKDNDTGKRAALICKAYGFEPNVTFELDQQMTAYNITCSDRGISFVSDTLIRSVKSTPEVTYYKLDSDNASRQICFYRKKSTDLSKALKEFIVCASCRNTTRIAM